MAYSISDDLSAGLAAIAKVQIEVRKLEALCGTCGGSGLIDHDDPEARSGYVLAPCPVCSCETCGTALPWHFAPCPEGCNGVAENGNDLPVAATIERDAGGYL